MYFHNPIVDSIETVYRVLQEINQCKKSGSINRDTYFDKHISIERVQMMENVRHSMKVMQDMDEEYDF